MNVKYETPLQAVYKYKKFNYGMGTGTPIRVACEVLESSKTQYKIRLKAVCEQHPIGHVMWVKKYNVELADEKHYDYSNAYWQK